MKYRLNSKQSKVIVEVKNLKQEKEQKLMNELIPYITVTNEDATHYIIVSESSENANVNYGNVLYVNYLNDNYMYKVLRQAIRDVLYQEYLTSGYSKLHASSVTDETGSTIIVGPNNSGKTSLALGLCYFENYKLIDGDLVLIKNDKLIGWQTSIGLRQNTAKILGFDYKENSELTWYWPIDLMNKGYSFESSGTVQNIVIPKINFDITKPKYKIIELEEKKKYLLDNLHYQEMNKNNYWNESSIDIESLRNTFFRNNDIINKTMIEFESNGLNKENMMVLKRILKGE